MTARWWRPTRRARVGTVEAVLMLDEAVAALGRRPEPSGRLEASRWAETVPVERIVGSVARHGDFDREFRPLTGEATARRTQLARLNEAVADRAVSLVRVGEVYFVEDGHHRVSLARARGRLAVDAAVRSLCTIAWACACLTRKELPVKTGERDFLAVVPLPDPVVHDLWLDDPAGYQRLARAAHSWATHTCADNPMAGCAMDPELAADWWDLDVLPRAHSTATAGGEGPPASTAGRYLATLTDQGIPR